MASVQIVSKSTGQFHRTISLAINLENIELLPDEMFSWESTFHRASLSKFDWQNRIMACGRARGLIQCTRMDYVIVRIEGDRMDEVYTLIHKANTLLGGIVVRCRKPMLSRWCRLKTWLKMKINTYGEWKCQFFGNTKEAGETVDGIQATTPVPATKPGVDIAAAVDRYGHH